MYPVLGVVILVLDIIALISVLGGSSSANHKLLWTIIILLMPVLGMILYYLIGRSPGDARVV